MATENTREAGSHTLAKGGTMCTFLNCLLPGGNEVWEGAQAVRLKEET